MPSYDSEWQAACHLLTSRGLGRETRPHIRPAKRVIDWRVLLEGITWSTSEQLLVEAAFALWRGTGGDLGRCANYLDDRQFRRLTEAMGLYRGDRPDLATYPGGW